MKERSTLHVVSRFQRGIRKASEVTGISTRQASIRAGYNQNQLNRFLGGSTDIRLVTLAKICLEGFGMSFETVWKLGEGK